MTRKVSIAIVAVALCAMLLPTAVMAKKGVASAKATKSPVAGTWVSEDERPPEKEWIDGDGIWHARGVYGSMDVGGDLTGVAFGVFQINLDLETGNGDAVGTLTHEVTWGILEGTFEGRFSVTYTEWWCDGQVIAHGTGDFEGMKLMITFTGWLWSPERNWEGIILDPHGE